MSNQSIRIGGHYYQDLPSAIGFAYDGPGWLRRIWVERAVKRLSRQLAMLLEADVSLPTALSLVRLQHKSVRWQRMLEEVEQRLQEGYTLSETLSHLPRYFRRGYVQTLLWAESRGDPGDLVLALRLLSGDTDYRRTAKQAIEDDYSLDTFARRLRG